MPITQEQGQKIQAWIRRTFPTGLVCPYCIRKNWTAFAIVTTLEYTPGGMAVGGQVVPLVQLVCDGCGHVTHFAAIPMGVTT